MVTVTVTTLTSTSPRTVQAGPSGPSTSTGATASGPVDTGKLAELVKLQRQSFQLLKQLGADTQGIDIQPEEPETVPIPIDSKNLSKMWETV